MLPSLELIHNAMKYSTDCLVGFLGATSPIRLFQIRGGEGDLEKVEGEEGGEKPLRVKA